MAKKNLAKKLNAIDEFEQRPVPESHTKGFKSFVGMVAGEHIAGTEFVIGPLFVAFGVAAKDLFLGLLIGNILAVLSWSLVCAPIATQKRLTIFYMLERIAGFNLVSVYNVINGLMGAFVGASMIAVSATAIGIPFNIPMPAINDILPTGPGWVITVLAVGSVITIVATLGYDQVSRFANIFAPWMPLIFIAAAIAVLPQLGVQSFKDFWPAAQEKIWTGIPMEGKVKFTIWHVIFFSWLCNTNQHLGLADTTIYRYAKKWYYGFASAAGMFVGHFMAWVASGILCAAALNTTPGPIAYSAIGIAGIICVVVAGWTTANPTIYRSGLAFQAVFPQVKRWKITSILGAVIMLLACFPGVINKLAEFLAFYALVAAPVGAVIVADVWVFPKLGLKSELAAIRQWKFNWIVAITWVLALAICQIFQIKFGIQGLEFFLGVPGWIIAFLSYLLFNLIYQRRSA